MKPVNLNRVRKNKVRAEKQAQANANAAKFGRTKAQRKADAEAAERADRHLDSHRREE